MRVYELISASDLQRHRGWTETLVLALLGAPDAHAPNPYGWRTPMRLYRMDRVLAAEREPAFERRVAQLNDRQTWRRAQPSRIRKHTEVDHLEWLDDPWRIRLFHAPRKPRRRRPRRPEPPVRTERFEVLTLF